MSTATKNGPRMRQLALADALALQVLITAKATPVGAQRRTVDLVETARRIRAITNEHLPREHDEPMNQYDAGGEA